MSSKRSTAELIAAATADGWHNDQLGKEILECLHSRPQPSRRVLAAAVIMALLALAAGVFSAAQLAKAASLEAKDRAATESIRSLEGAVDVLKTQLAARDAEISRQQSSNQGTLELFNRKADTLTKHLQDQNADLSAQRAMLEKRVMELEAELRARPVR